MRQREFVIILVWCLLGGGAFAAEGDNALATTKQVPAPFGDSRPATKPARQLTAGELNRWPHFKVTIRGGIMIFDDHFNDPHDNALFRPGNIDDKVSAMEKHFLTIYGDNKTSRALFDENYRGQVREILEFLRDQSTASLPISAFGNIHIENGYIPVYTNRQVGGVQNQVISDLYVFMGHKDKPLFALGLNSDNGISTAPYGWTWDRNVVVPASDVKPPFEYSFPKDATQQRYILTGPQYGTGTSGAYFEPTAVTVLNSPVYSDGSIKRQVPLVFTKDLRDGGSVEVFWMWSHHLKQATSEEAYEVAASRSPEQAKQQLGSYYERTVSVSERWSMEDRFKRLQDPSGTIVRLCKQGAGFLARAAGSLSGPKALPAPKPESF